MAKTTRDFVRLAVRAAEGHKAQDIVCLDLRGRSSVTDYFVIASGTSDTHVRAIADAVREQLAAAGQRPLSFEGYDDGTWVLIDFVDFVVHVFHYEKRIYFGLEELWSDARPVVFRAAPKAAAPKAPATRRTAAGKAAAAKKAPARPAASGAKAAAGRSRAAKKKA
jgi:ribosome-associated protein